LASSVYLAKNDINQLRVKKEIVLLSTIKKVLIQPINLIFLFCLGYFVLQLWLIPQLLLAADEFFFAHHIYQYLHQLPYRDFPPYKTVLGYYLLAPAFLFSQDSVQPFFYFKAEIALLNSVFFFVAIYWAKRYFYWPAILLTCSLIVANQLFIIYTDQIRADMLSCWLGLFAALFVLSNKKKSAGILLGIAFLTSQKALWFWAATDFGLMICWLSDMRNMDLIKKTIWLNVSAILVIIGYIIFWSFISSPSVVLRSLFYEAYIQSKITWYSYYHHVYWQAILRDGPILMLLWPVTWLPLFDKEKNNSISNRSIFIIGYASSLLLLMISYQQAFPYNTVFLLPAFFLAYSDFFSWLLAGKYNEFSFSKKFLLLSFGFILSIILFLSYYFSLQIFYYFIILIPIFLYAIFQDRSHGSKIFFKKILIYLVFIFGVLTPLVKILTLPAYIIANGDYQQSMIALAHQLLEPSDSYIAGTPLLYDKNQAVLGLKNLIEPAISYLYQPDKKIAPLLLESLYMSPRTSQQVLQDLALAPVKFYVHDVRTDALPDNIKQYFSDNFQHFYGSIYLYAPKINLQQKSFHLKFSGNYKINSSNISDNFVLDGKKVANKEIIYLSKGTHKLQASSNFRLIFIPKNIDLRPYKKYQKERNLHEMLIVIM